MVQLAWERFLAPINAEVVLTSPDGTDRDGYGVRFTDLDVDEDFHAEVRIYISDGGVVVGPGSKSKGRVTFDMLLAASPGETTVEILQGAPSLEVPLDLPDLPPLWRLVAGIASPIGDPSPEGWWQHVRQEFGTSQYFNDGKGGGAGISGNRFAESTTVYSRRTEYVNRSIRNGHEGMTTSGESDRSWTWNGETQ